jgi:biopolymer transport protein ExbB
MVEAALAWMGLVELVGRGGAVLLVIMAITFVMWALIVERLWYLKSGHVGDAEEVAMVWAARSDRRSWSAQQIRYALISQLANKLNRSLGMIASLVAICPLLGLLGTVTGMIEVFDVVAMTGSGNTRAMAAGVSKATVPTVAGMVAALSGYYFSVRLRRTAASEIQSFADRLTTET